MLVCTDLSPSSNRVVKVAISLAQQTGAHLSFIHVRPLLRPHEQKHHSAGDGSYSALEQQVRALCPPDIAAEIVQRHGIPSISILQRMRAHPTDLVLLGTRCELGPERAMFGSTAESVLRLSKSPVMIVGPNTAESAGMFTGPVVFFTDFHAPISIAVKHAVDLAYTLHRPLHCVHILPAAMSRGRQPGQIIPQIMLSALQELVRQSAPGAGAVHNQVIYGDGIPNAIVTYAREHRASAIVLGARKTGMLASHLNPQIIYQVLCSSKCPVVTAAFP